MHVVYECRGGGPGLFFDPPLRDDFDTEALAQSERERIEALVGASGILTAHSSSIPSRPQATEGYDESLSVTDGERSGSYEGADTSAPPGMQALLSELRNRALRRRAGA